MIPTEPVGSPRRAGVQVAQTGMIAGLNTHLTRSTHQDEEI